LWASKRNGRVS